jgi:uncharacterized protein (TIGR00159 family)
MIDFGLSFSLSDVIDVAIISYIIYKLLLLIKGTRAFNMMFGIFLLVLLSFLSKFFGLKTTNWMLSNFSGYLFLTIVILFSPEIRRALAYIGNTKVFGGITMQDDINVIDELIKTSTLLANRQIGALIVIKRISEIDQFIQGAHEIDAKVTKDLLMSIFNPYSPLHDGAVIIENNRISKAGAILPLTKKLEVDQRFGTRHRAAIGITEESDAVCLVISEERGTISVSVNGHISTELSAEMLRETLENLLHTGKK